MGWGWSWGSYRLRAPAPLASSGTLLARGLLSRSCRNRPPWPNPATHSPSCNPPGGREPCSRRAPPLWPLLPGGAQGRGDGTLGAPHPGSWCGLGILCRAWGSVVSSCMILVSRGTLLTTRTHPIRSSSQMFWDTGSLGRREYHKFPRLLPRRGLSPPLIPRATCFPPNARLSLINPRSFTVLPDTLSVPGTHPVP